MKREASILEKLQAKGFKIWLEDGKVHITPRDSLTPEQIRFLKRHRHQIVAEAVDRLDPSATDSIRTVLAVIGRGYAVQFRSKKTGTCFWVVPNRKVKERLSSQKRLPQGAPVYGVDELRELARASLNADDLERIGDLVAMFDASLIMSSRDDAQTAPASDSSDPISVVTRWLDRIGEKDPAIREAVLEKSRNHPEALQCYLRCAAEHGIIHDPPDPPETDQTRTGSHGKRRSRSRLIRPD